MSIAKIVDSVFGGKIGKICSISHEISKQVSQQSWDYFIDEMKKIEEITINEFISGVSTLTADFVAYMVLAMKQQVDKDDTGYTIEELLEVVIEGACKAMRINKISMERTDLKEKTDFKTKL